MRIYYDCEFVERGRDLPIQLVSIGLVREDGQELYRINPECLSNVAKHAWLSVNVAPYLPMTSPSQGIIAWDEHHTEYPYVAVSLDALVDDVRAFLQSTPDLELWADYGAYDHVVLCQLFGSMNELPAGIPMFTRDIRELVIRNPHIDLPPQGWNVHHALEDARWARDTYRALTAHEPRELTATVSEGPQEAEIVGEE